MHLKQGLIGAHTSAAGGLHRALEEGKEIGATTIQLFTANQKQWQGRLLTQTMIDDWMRVLQETGLSQIMSHDSYLINLGGPRVDVLEKSRHAFSREIERCLQLHIAYLNFHPGASLNGTLEECLDRIVESLFSVRPFLERGNTRLLLETTAGQGSAVGHRFEHLAYIIQRLKGEIPIGVCMDTCHLFAAGYDVRTAQGWEKTLTEFDQIVGLPFLYAFHLNDSLKELGSRVDRHQPLGEGKIGWDCFRFLMTDPRTCALPKYLETPGGPERWKQEIRACRQIANCLDSSSFQAGYNGQAGCNLFEK